MSVSSTFAVEILNGFVQSTNVTCDGRCMLERAEQWCTAHGPCLWGNRPLLR